LPLKLPDFSIDLILPATLWPQGWQPLTEMTIRNLPGGKRQLAHKADNLTPICEPNAYKMWEPRCLTNLWASTTCFTGIALPFFTSKQMYIP
jgi:hypothetical protein